MYYLDDEKDILNLKDKSIVAVIPVNCVGVMGAGLAKQFANKYPSLVALYKQSCSDGNLSIGHCVLEDTEYGKFIFFPTKQDWRDPSEIEYIESGLDSICKCMRYFPNLKIAFPPLGCGLGGLDSNIVLSLIYEKTKECSNDKYLVGF